MDRDETAAKNQSSGYANTAPVDETIAPVGRQDDVLPVARCGRRVAHTLQAQGFDVDYREFNGGHTVPAEMVDAGVNRLLS
jgi:predicted esterase